jgi:hypothetical protein
LRKFSLPYASTLVEDSNGLLFYYLKGFDTSFIVKIKNKKEGIFGVYYYTTPPLHRNIFDVKTDTDELLFFRGISFKIDENKWNQIKKNASAIVDRNDTVFNKSSCSDCQFFYLSHGGRASSTVIQKPVYFEPFMKLLKDSMINHFIDIQKKELSTFGKTDL